MISSYKEGVDLLNVGDYFAASKKFLEAEILFPQSMWAPKSVLMASYSYFLQGYYTLSIENIKRYLKTYPKDKNKPYAHYLLAMCYYETIEGEKKDLAPLILSKKETFCIFGSKKKQFLLFIFCTDFFFSIHIVN